MTGNVAQTTVKLRLIRSVKVSNPPQCNLRILDLRSNKSCNSLQNEQFQIKRNQQSVNAQTVNQ